MDKIVKIFVVDDDEMVSMALEDCLGKKPNYEIHLFKTGEECLECLGERPDIIILDYNLNSVKKDAANGLVILDAIKKLNETVKIVMLSSQDSTLIVLETVRKGASEYIVKDEHAFEKIMSFCEAVSV